MSVDTYGDTPPVKRGDFHFCPRCWDAGKWCKLRERDCTECGYSWDSRFLDFGNAYCLALKQGRDGEVEVDDSCCLCTNPIERVGLKLCTNCGGESCYGHKVDVLKFFVDPDPDLSNLHPDAATAERVKLSKP